MKPQSYLIPRLRLFIGVLSISILVCDSLPAQKQRQWIRYPAISPDGKQIAFSFAGDIWVVPSKGGAARPVTTHTGYERSPVWSPDSQTIAFMADWHGNGDVFQVRAAGGQPVRLTHHSASDVPTSFTPDGAHILFTSQRQDAPQARIGSSAMGELYSIPVAGGRPRQIMTTTAEFANFDKSGKRIVFQDYKGFEDYFRKHHTSSVTRDIWIYEPDTKKYQRVSGFRGEDRCPVWSADGKSIYFLSEQLEGTAPGETGKNQLPDADSDTRVIPQLDSSLNVWKVDAHDFSKQQQISRHTSHPVRYLSVANDGTLCYNYNGEIWLVPEGSEPQKLAIKLQTGLRDNLAERKIFKDSATEFTVSPNEEEVAFVVRGEVFVANIEFGSTRRITETPAQERSVTWGSDSRTLYYAGERNQSWNIYQATIDREDEPGFAYATIIDEEPVLETSDETFQPVCSPDGKRLAYLRNRTELRVLDLVSGETRIAIPAKLNFSYADGDIEFDWSGDSQWLVATYHGRESWISEIAAVNLQTGEITNVTESGYGEGNPRFATGGQAILYGSDRYGQRSHGSWGAESDVIAVYLTQALYDEATLSKEQLALKKKRQEKDKPSDDQSDDESDDDNNENGSGEGAEAGEEDDDQDAAASESDAAEDEDEDDVEPMEFDTRDLDLRRRRLTLHSASLATFDLSPDGEHLLYVAQVDDKWGLWLTAVRDHSTSHILTLQGAAEAHFSEDGKQAFLLQNGRLAQVDLSGALNGNGQAKLTPIDFAAEMEINSPGERAYIFEHAWRQVQQKFYDKNLHGVDWQQLKANYSSFLNSINNDYDFADLLSEMLGELNASHTGARYRPRRENADETASLGLLYDVNFYGDGLKVAEVIERGPCDSADCRIQPGTVITHINGQPLSADTNPWPLFNRQVDQPMRLGLKHESEEWEEVIRPISRGAENNLLYERWIANCREMCEELSDGKLGYVHVRGMNDASFRRVYSEVLGRNNEKAALIVDTRFNGGGWLHEDLATFLSGKRYCQFAPRGHEDGGLGGEPINKWTKPVVVLQSESNYSDAHFFPWAFKEKQVGKLVGAPVPGTATAVWWEPQINNQIVFGIPQVGMLTNQGKYLENNQLEPDVRVLNEPADLAAGDDPQLRKAVELLLKDVGSKQ